MARNPRSRPGRRARTEPPADAGIEAITGSPVPSVDFTVWDGNKTQEGAGGRTNAKGGACRVPPGRGARLGWVSWTGALRIALGGATGIPIRRQSGRSCKGTGRSRRPPGGCSGGAGASAARTCVGKGRRRPAAGPVAAFEGGSPLRSSLSCRTARQGWGKPEFPFGWIWTGGSRDSITRPLRMALRPLPATPR